MGSEIQKEVSDVHYNIDESLTNFSDNRFDQGISNQRFVITSANNLANNLSDLLENLMNASASMGKGKGNSSDFSLPDIIKKQGELAQKMKDGMKKDTESGDRRGKEGEQEHEQMNGELYEIYKQQTQLRQALKELLGEPNNEGNGNSAKALKEMEALEREMLERGFSKEVIDKMQQLNYELLKLEKATLEQGEDIQRKSNTNNDTFEKRNIEKLKLQKQYFNSSEILNRQSLPLRTIYKKKVQEYFRKEE